MELRAFLYLDDFYRFSLLNKHIHKFLSKRSSTCDFQPWRSHVLKHPRSQMWNLMSINRQWCGSCWYEMAHHSWLRVISSGGLLTLFLVCLVSSWIVTLEVESDQTLCIFRDVKRTRKNRIGFVTLGHCRDWVFLCMNQACIGIYFKASTVLFWELDHGLSFCLFFFPPAPPHSLLHLSLLYFLPSVII